MNDLRKTLLTVQNKKQEIEAIINKEGIDYSSKKYIQLSKELSEISILLSEAQDLFKKDEELKNSIELFENSNDKEIQNMAEIEIADLQTEITDLENKLMIMLLPKDFDDNKNAILEIASIDKNVSVCYLSSG
jgi:peptide chain release factor 1